MNKPNIFKYATKELSQDAFIFWLLDHANPIYENVDKEIKTCALNLIEFFFNLENKKMPETINKFELRKQEKSIDIVLYLNEFMIVIEDKVNTNSHSNQLFRYKSYAENKMGKANVLAIYFKTYDQSNYKKEEDDGFKVFHRQDLLKLLDKTVTDNDIILDFKSHIFSIEEEVSNFQIKEAWNHQNWTGFFKYLQKELNAGDWGYVPNQNGGFMGYWWAFNKNELCTQYLQLQEDDLVLKINSKSEKYDKKFRNLCYKHYLEKAKQAEISFNKPIRFGVGETMTILTTKYIVRDKDSNLINIEKTKENIVLYTNFINNNFLKLEDFI